MPVQDKTIQVNNLNVHYWESDDEHPRTLLLLHGGIGSAETHWKAIIPALADSYQIIAPDLPGFGKTDILPTMTVDMLAEWLRDLLNALRINQAAVIGSSFGGLVARVFAAVFPQRVPAVILVNGGSVPRFPLAMRLLARVPALKDMVFSMASQSQTSLGGLKKLTYIHDILTEQFIWQARAESKGLAEVLRLLSLNPPPTQLMPPVPTLLLWGEDDGVLPLSVAQALRKELSNATLVPVAKCGHFPHLETPEVFAFQVKKFLDQQSAVSTSELPGLPLKKNWQ